MSRLLNRDYKEMLVALSEEGADFLVIGAFAVAAHAAPRSTGDFDVFVRPTPDNAAKVWRALCKYGAPLQGISKSDFENPDLIYQIGVIPCRIDIVTSISGLDFETAWSNRVQINLEGLCVPIIGLADLIVNKRASGRPKDLVDLRNLEAVQLEGKSPPPKPRRRRLRT